MSAHSVILATWNHEDSGDEASIFPQMGGMSGGTTFNAIYWRCIVVFFALSRRFNPEARHVVYTNRAQLPTVDGVDLGKLLTDWNVEFRSMPFTNKPPKGWYKSWMNQFYLLDILRDMANWVPEDASVMVFDSDCAFVRSVDRLHQRIQKEGITTYDMAYSEDHNINGLTRKDLNELLALSGGAKLAEPMVYAGGEIFAGRGDRLKALVKELDRLWQWSLERFSQGESKFNEEAHLLSAAYAQLEAPQRGADPSIRRIWTSPHHFDAKPSDLELDIWHLPSEKQFGFAYVFPAAVDKNSWLWTLDDESLRKRLAFLMGIPKPSLAKKLRDTWARVKKRLKR